MGKIEQVLNKPLSRQPYFKRKQKAKSKIMTQTVSASIHHSTDQLPGWTLNSLVVAMQANSFPVHRFQGGLILAFTFKQSGYCLVKLLACLGFPVTMSIKYLYEYNVFITDRNDGQKVYRIHVF